MRHLSLLLSVLLLLLTGCPKPPGFLLPPERPLNGRVEWAQGYEIQATTTEVANGSTVSLIDPSTGTTVVTTLTQPDGSFSLNIKNAAFQSDRPYLLEALKGLSAGGVANRAGAPGARIRTLVSLTSGSWTSLTGSSVRINPSTTALCIVSGFRALNLPQQQALMGTLPPATGAYAGTPDLPSGDFTAVQALVNASLLLDQDPVRVIARNALTGSYVRMERGPFITNLSVLRATPGTVITLYGTGLDPVAANNLIRFNGTAASSMSLVPGGIAVSVPTGATVGPLTLKVGNLETVAAPTFSPVLPMTTLQTVAGTYIPLPGTQATGWGFRPQTVAADGAGNIYYSDNGSNQVFKVSATGTVTLIAGRGGAGYSGDNGPGPAAQLNTPSALAVDAAGNVFIGDCANYRIRRVDATTGIITTIAGNGNQGSTGDGGAANLARLYYPSSLAFDATGNLYLLDNKRIRKIDTGGTISLFAGTGTGTGDGIPATTAVLDDPRSLGADGLGNLYLAQMYATKTLCKISPDGNLWTLTTGVPSMAVCADATGNVYYHTANTYTVVKIASGGGSATVAGTANNAGFAGDGGAATSAKISPAVYGLAFAGGSLYIPDYTNSRIRKVSAGVITTVAGNGGRFGGDSGQATDAQLNQPQAAITDAQGTLYIADTSNYRIRKVAAGTGAITTFAGTGAAGTGGNGGPASSATFGSILDLALDGSGTMYVLDGATVRKIAPDGTITHYAGGGASLGDNGPAASARFNSPNGLALDGSGNLYVADYANHRIRKIDKATGTITTVAGTGGGGASGDGGLATAAGVPYPTDVAFDAAGNMYLSGYTYTIRKVNTAGVISTIAGNGSSVNSGDGGPALSARVDYTNGIAVDGVGNVYIAAGTYVRVIDVASGIIRAAANVSSGSGFNGDGNPATACLLGSLARLSTDPQGNILIADMNNHRIRRLY